MSKEAISNASGSTSPTGADGCTQDFRASSHAREATSTPSGNWVFLELVKDRWESDGLSQVFLNRYGDGIESG